MQLEARIVLYMVASHGPVHARSNNYSGSPANIHFVPICVLLRTAKADILLRYSLSRTHRRLRTMITEPWIS